MNAYDIALQHDFTQYSISIDTDKVNKSYTHLCKDSNTLIPLLFDEVFLDKYMNNYSNTIYVKMNLHSIEFISLIINTTLKYQKHIRKNIHFDKTNIIITFVGTCTKIIIILAEFNINFNKILYHMIGINFKDQILEYSFVVEPCDTILGYRYRIFSLRNIKNINNDMMYLLHFQHNPYEENDHNIQYHCIKVSSLLRDITNDDLLYEMYYNHYTINSLHEFNKLSKITTIIIDKHTNNSKFLEDFEKGFIPITIKEIYINRNSTYNLLYYTLLFLYKQNCINKIEIKGDIWLDHVSYENCELFDTIRKEYGNHKILGLFISHIKKYNTTLYEKSLMDI